MASRKLSDLHSDFRPLVEKFLDAVDDEGIDLLIYCTYRSDVEQAALYAQGRTTKGRIVTNAKAGESLHNVKLNGNPASRAFDAVPLVSGKPMWDPTHPHWQVLGKTARALGLEWAGDWKRFKEYPHFQKREEKQ